MNILDKKGEIRQIINQSSNVFIIGHTDLDLDALGSIIGMLHIIEQYKKDTFIILDDKKHEKGVEKVLRQIKNDYNFLNSNQLDNIINSNSLLIIVDTNKEKLISNNIINKFSKIVVIDHHDLTSESLNNGLIVVDINASSTCEMITELIKDLNVKINSNVATLLLSGIVLDTSNFVLKTTAKTYYLSGYLTEVGVIPNEVQYLLKQDINKYIERQKVITNVKIINKNIALTSGIKKEIYKREDLAKIADTLLMFEVIEASFVIGKLDKDIIGISARSLGNIDVNKILRNFKGGGDSNNAAAKIENTTIEQVKLDLIKILSNI